MRAHIAHSHLTSASASLPADSSLRVGSKISEILYRFSFSKSLSTTLIPHTCFLYISECCSQQREAKACFYFSHTHLIHLNYDEQLVVLQINFVARPNERRNLLDHTIPAQDIVVTEGRPDRELLALCQMLNSPVVMVVMIVVMEVLSEVLAPWASITYLALLKWILMKVWFQHLKRHLLKSFF